MKKRKYSDKIRFYVALLLLIPLSQLCYQILNQNYPHFDLQIARELAERRLNWLNSVFIIIYQISGAHITGFIVFAALIVLIRLRYWQEAKILGFATLGILILVDEILKPFFDRRRPPQPRLVKDLSRDSFPSGHAAGNLVLYFYLSFILAIRYPKLAKYIYGLATVIVVLIGFSSVYVNAHWASDILAGYAFGYLWLLVSLTVLQFSSKERNQQKPSDPN